MMRAFKTLMASALIMVFSWPCAAFAGEVHQSATQADEERWGGVAAEELLPVASADTVLEISTAEEFAKFAESINSGERNYGGWTVALTADIELTRDTPSVGVASQNSFVYQVDKSFQGTFDGRGHSILLKGKPLFGMLYGTQSRPVQVKNLVLGGSVTVDAPYAGAVASVADGYVQMENVGNNAAITNTCVLYESAGSGTGGLVGYVPATYNSYYYNKDKFGKPDSLTLTGCYNKGAVTSSCEGAGGLVGSFQGKNAPLVIDRCYVSGAVTSTQKRVGGFVGSLVEGDRMRVMEFKNSFIAGKLETSVVVDETRDESQLVGTLVGYSNTSLPGAGKVANVFCGGDLAGGKSYGDIPQEAFKSIIPAGVPYLNLTNGDTTLASLNAAPADDATPYTAENGFTFAQGATSETLPQLHWEAAASKAPVAKPQATMPTAVTGLTYTGSPQAGVTPAATDGCGYTLAGWQSTDAGTHTATVTLEDGYEWADGSTQTTRTVVYNIDKATLTARYAGETIEAGATPGLVVTVVGFRNGETEATAKDYVAPAITAPTTEAGKSYELTPAGGSAANYDFRYVGGTLTVNAVPKPQLTSANTFIAVDTRGTKVEVVVLRGAKLLVEKRDYTLSYRNAAGKALSAAPTKKGTYSVTVTGMGAYEGTVSQTFTLSSDLETTTPAKPTTPTKPTTPSSGQTDSTTDKKSTTTTVKKGTKFKVKDKTGTYTYKVTGTKTATLTKAKVKSGKKASINKAKYQKTTFKVTAIAAKAFKSTKAKAVTLGSNVKKIGKRAFTGSTFKKLTVKSKSLKKANVKKCLTGSKITTVKAPKGYAKKYSKVFTKKVAGKKVTVK